MSCQKCLTVGFSLQAAERVVLEAENGNLNAQLAELALHVEAAAEADAAAAVSLGGDCLGASSAVPEVMLAHACCKTACGSTAMLDARPAPVLTLSPTLGPSRIGWLALPCLVALPGVLWLMTMF